MNNKYYQSNGIEAIDVIDAYGLSFNLGNVVKYVLRAGKKTEDSVQDLKKAADYLNHEIELREKPITFDVQRLQNAKDNLEALQRYEKQRGRTRNGGFGSTN